MLHKENAKKGLIFDVRAKILIRSVAKTLTCYISLEAEFYADFENLYIRTYKASIKK